MCKLLENRADYWMVEKGGGTCVVQTPSPTFLSKYLKWFVSYSVSDVTELITGSKHPGIHLQPYSATEHVMAIKLSAQDLVLPFYSPTLL